jgi:hypothetical protein
MSLTEETIKQEDRLQIRKRAVLKVIHSSRENTWAKSFWLKTYTKLLEQQNEAKALSRRSN